MGATPTSMCFAKFVGAHIVRFHRAAGEGPGQRLGLEFAGLQATEPQLKKRKGHFAKLLKKASVIARFNPLYGMCSVGRLASCLESSTLERCWLLCAVLRVKSVTDGGFQCRGVVTKRCAGAVALVPLARY